MNNNRYTLIDYLRTLAIVLMVAYHCLFDLSQLRFIDVSIFNSLPATVVGRASLVLFLFCVGYSLALSHSNGIQWQKFFRRLLKISFFAGAVSLGTYISNPEAWIYFGILHHIAVASVAGLLFLRIPIIALLLGIACMAAFWGWGWYLPWIHLPRPSLDYIALFPWFGCVLVGIGCYRFQPHRYIRPPELKAITWLSEKSLWIYLIHQPVMMGSLWLLRQALH